MSRSRATTAGKLRQDADCHRWAPIHTDWGKRRWTQIRIRTPGTWYLLISAFDQPSTAGKRNTLIPTAETSEGHAAPFSREQNGFLFRCLFFYGKGNCTPSVLEAPTSARKSGR